MHYEVWLDDGTNDFELLVTTEDLSVAIAETLHAASGPLHETRRLWAGEDIILEVSGGDELEAIGLRALRLAQDRREDAGIARIDSL